MARGTAYSFAVCALVLMSGPSLESTATTEVPFELYQGHLIVTEGSIGPLNGLNLLIDTGTIPSMVSKTVARKLRLQTGPAVLVAFGRRASIQSAMIDGFRIGSVSSGPVPVGIGDLSYLQEARIDAIVGLDVLVHTPFVVDYRARVLKFVPEMAAAATAALEVTWPFVTVALTTAGQQVRLLVDTGSRDVVLFTSRVPDIVKTAPWRGDKKVYYASGEARLRRLDLRQVHLGRDRWDALPAWALDRMPDGYPADIDGVLGVRALGCQTMLFDFGGMTLGCIR